MTTAEQLTEILPKLGPDEQRVLLRIAERLVLGCAQYGQLNIASDRRNWTEEAAQEALDLSVYLAIRTVCR